MWGVASAVLAWRFLPYLTLSPLYVVLVACLSFFLLAGVFNVSVNVVSHFLKDNTRVGEGPGTPAVAVLYCTYNDFDRGAASSALRLTYPHLSVWILDDSMDPGSRRDVDAFAEEASEHGRPVRIVRRSDRKGFKAGAINHVLRLLPPEVRYVAIVDADEVLAPDFVEGCLRHFTRADVGFVQANHRCTNGSASWFTRYMGVGVDLHWRHYQRYRNRYGTVNMLGHGALVRRFALPLGRSRARWYEKMDLLLPSVSLPGVFVLLAFLAIVHGLQWAGWGLPVFDDPVVMGLGLFASFAPLTMFVDLWRRPVFALKAVVLNTVAYLGLVPVSVHGLLLGVARPAEFLVTPKGARGPLCVCKAAFDTRLEIAFGMTLLGLGVATLGPWGLVSPIAVVALLAPLLMVVSRRSLPAT